MQQPLWHISLVLLATSFCAAVQAATDDSAAYYTAGVVEFRPSLSGSSAADMLSQNLRAYIEIIHSAKAKETDIIVFPEGTLNNAMTLTYVPDPQDNVIPCLLPNWNTYEDFLVKLSCSARSVRKYLVVNLSEKEDCSAVPYDPRPCASTGLNVYNTNVVFDRDGRVVSRYRKVHIYVEPKNTTLQPEFAIFETDFGVRFGHFICFDILFYTPAKELIDRFGVTNLIFTSFFFSELPFLTAVQLQQGWAWGNNVSLLAAGASYPRNGVTGSGIYSGRQGALVSVMAGGSGERKLYVARVPKIPPTTEPVTQSQAPLVRPPQLGVRLMKDPQISNFNSELLHLNRNRKITRQLCHGELCCKFKIVTELLPFFYGPTSYYKYRIGVFDGRRTYEKKEWSDIQVCAVYACANDNVASCGQLIEDSTAEANFVFKHISIEGQFKKVDKLLIRPSSLDRALYPLRADAVSWQTKDRSTYHDVSFTLNEETDDLLTFGIYANYYTRSDRVDEPNFSSNERVSNNEITADEI